MLPLRLEGSGTRSVEALPSYLCRLSYVHGVKPGYLVRYLLQQEESSRRLEHVLGAQAFAALARPNATTAEVIRLLAKGGSERLSALQRSTFLFLHPALSRSPSAYAKTLRWCPACLHEQLMSCGHAFLKLSWFLRAVTACEVHRILLRDKCPHCQRSPRPWRGWSLFDRCLDCGNRLDIVSDSDCKVLSVEAVAKDMVDLVEAIATAHAPFPAGAVNGYIARLFDDAWSTRSEHELWNRLPRDECLQYMNDGEPISLNIARRLAYRLELPLADLLQGGIERNKCFGFAVEEQLPSTMRSAHRSGRINPVILAKQIRLLLVDDTKVTSVREVAHQLGVSVGAMRYHEPDLVRKIAERYINYRKGLRLKKRAIAMAAVLEHVRGWQAVDAVPIAKKRLLKHLIRATGLPKEILRRAIKDVLSEQVA